MFLPLPDMFHRSELTNVINLMPNEYTVLRDDNLFPFMGIATTSASIVRNTEGLCLVPAAEWCAPPRAVNKGRKQDIVTIQIPHTPIIDQVLPCDIRNRANWDLNSDQGLMNLTDEVNLRLQTMRSKLEQTLEYRRTRALFGEILDADGSMMLSLFKAFQYDPVEFLMDFSDPKFNLRQFCMKLKRHMDVNFKGNYSRIRVMLNGDAMDALTNHPNVTDIFKRCCDTQNKVTDDTRNSFIYSGVEFWECASQGCFYDADGVSQPADFMAAPWKLDGSGKVAGIAGVAYPWGSTNNFETIGAPSTMNDAVNQKASELYYVNMEPRCHNEGYEMKAQMNALPIMKQPLALPRIKVKYS